MIYDKEKNTVTISLDNISSEEHRPRRIPELLDALAIMENGGSYALWAFAPDNTKWAMWAIPMQLGVVKEMTDAYLRITYLAPYAERANEKSIRDHLEFLTSDKGYDVLAKLTERQAKMERLRNLYGDNWREHLNEEEEEGE